MNNFIRKGVVLLGAGLVSAAAFAQPARQTAGPELLPQTVELHHVSLSYGGYSVYGFRNVFSDLFPDLQASMVDEGIHTGAVTFGYTYQLTPALSVGGLFSYAGTLGSIQAKPTNYRVYQNFFSLMPQVKYNWLEKGTWRLYSRLAVGVVIANIAYQEGVSVTTPLTAASFAFQVSPIGFEFGRSLAGFAEAGFGATGIVAVGIRKSF